MKTHNSNNSLLDIWEKLGNQNPWIRKAYDPPFDKSMLKKCTSIEELKNQIGHGNWCLGQGFYYLNLCFINQINGGDEWLTIKDDYVFESYTFSGIIKEGTFESYINRMLQATREQCLNLEY